jgi:phage major head subunit gpT-like protein
VGELTFVVLKDQFEKLRDGDRFWYENDPAFEDADIKRRQRTRLSNVLKRNTGIRNPAANVFMAD